MRVIILFKKKTGEKEVYKSIPALCEHNPIFDRDVLHNTMSRKKKPYEDDEFLVTRHMVITRIKKPKTI